MGLAAERVGTHVDKLLAEGEDSLYAKEETAKDREALAREVLGFVSDYNMMMRKLAATGNSADEAYARKLKSQVSTCQDALKQLGITQDSQGILGMDNAAFSQAELSDIRKVFQDPEGPAARIKELAEEVHTNAARQIDSVKKESYTISSNYNGSGTEDIYTRTTGNRYNTKG